MAKTFPSDPAARDAMRVQKVEYIARYCPFNNGTYKICGSWCPFFYHGTGAVRLFCTGVGTGYIFGDEEDEEKK